MITLFLTIIVVLIVFVVLLLFVPWSTGLYNFKNIFCSYCYGYRLEFLINSQFLMGELLLLTIYNLCEHLLYNLTTWYFIKTHDSQWMAVLVFNDKDEKCKIEMYIYVCGMTWYEDTSRMLTVNEETFKIKWGKTKYF